MRQITDEQEPQLRIVEGLGYIYNDSSGTNATDVYANLLHVASGTTPALANLYVVRYFAPDRQEAVDWINAHRPNDWEVCPICTS
jgi:hypothetical protein